MGNVQTLHFRCAADTGLLITNIAYEHLIYDCNPKKAIETITESLQGSTPEFALKVLKGEYIIGFDVDEQCFIVDTERNEELHKDYPKINPIEFMENQLEKITDNGIGQPDGQPNGLVALLKAVQRKMKRNSFMISVAFDYDDIFNFIAGNNEAVLDELNYNHEINEIKTVIITTKKFIERTILVMSLMEWMFQNFDDFKTDNENHWLVGVKNNERYHQIKGECHDVLMDVTQTLQDTILGRLDDLDLEEKELNDYIKATNEITTTLSAGIKPVNILDNYSAGWLAPNGDYYGLNGEIANMLHIQIANALLSAGIIPSDYQEQAFNPDIWLEQQGWVKIHDNNVQFAGCLNHHHIGLKNIDMTAIQIKKIYEYCAICYSGVIRLGWKMELMSASMFQLMAESNLQAMYDKYFEF
jgi:hypothetical protein